MSPKLSDWLKAKDAELEQLDKRIAKEKDDVARADLTYERWFKKGQRDATEKHIKGRGD